VQFTHSPDTLVSLPLTSFHLEDMKVKSAKREPLGLGDMIGVAIAFVVLSCVVFVVIFPEKQDRYFAATVVGAIGSLLSGLAIAGVAYTLSLQRQALDRVGRQSFESMLVQLIGFHHAILGGIHVNYGNTIFEGRSALRHLTEILDSVVNVRQKDEEDGPNLHAVRRLYEQFYRSNGVHLDHYFRNLYHIIKYIDEEGGPKAHRYTSLVRAQLSASELILLFYDGLSKEGEKFKPLIEKYALLEQLHSGQPQITNRRALYLSTAYGGAHA
jgi:hypothetical protein